MKSLILIGFIFFLPDQIRAQGGIQFGYNGCIGKSQDINRLIYVYNLKGGFEKEMGYIWGAYGLSAAYYHALDDKIYYELQWQNRHSLVHSQIELSSIMYQRDFKLRQNFGSAGFNFGRPFYMGLNIDVGNWKGFTRIITTDSIAEIKYTQIFTIAEGLEIPLYKTMQVGMTLYCGWESDFFGCRLYAQYQFMNKALDNLDNTLLGFDMESGNYLTDKFNNLGLEVYIKLGKK